MYVAIAPVSNLSGVIDANGIVYNTLIVTVIKLLFVKLLITYPSDE